MKNSQPKRYRLINDEAWEHCDTPMKAGEIYEAHHCPSKHLDICIQDYVNQTPQDWELVTDEPEPFKPTHEINTGHLRNEPVIILHRKGNLCKVEDEHGITHHLSIYDLTELNPPTTLTEQQHNSLVKAFYNTIMNSNDELGMADMGEAKDLAEQTVREWAEQNNIQLP